MHYVAGFMFDHSRTRVALIRKAKPAWQRGKLNGIGGKVEEGENVFDAMAREFAEETGYETTAQQWEQFMRMGGDNDAGTGAFRVDFFATVGDLERVRTMEEEPVEVVWLKDIHSVRGDMIENLPWLIPLALDYLADGRPGFVEAHYMPPGWVGGGGWGVGDDASTRSRAGSASAEPSDKREREGTRTDDVRESRWWWVEKREERRSGHAWMPTRGFIYRENAELESRQLSAMGWTARIVEVVAVERRKLIERPDGAPELEPACEAASMQRLARPEREPREGTVPGRKQKGLHE